MLITQQYCKTLIHCTGTNPLLNWIDPLSPRVMAATKSGKGQPRPQNEPKFTFSTGFSSWVGWNSVSRWYTSISVMDLFTFTPLHRAAAFCWVPLYNCGVRVYYVRNRTCQPTLHGILKLVSRRKHTAVDRNDPLKPFYCKTNDIWPLETIATNGQSIQNPKNIDINGKSAKKFNGDGFLKNNRKLQWSL